MGSTTVITVGFDILVNIFILISLTHALELRHVTAIWRHGDRAPKKLPYPNDVFNENYWPNGWAQLTDIGAAQMNELGQFFRNQYVGSFLSRHYSRKEMEIISANSDRALLSAQNFVNGFYPPTWGNNSEILQKVPIHASSPLDNDPLLKPSAFKCPMYEESVRCLNAQLYTQLSQEYRNLLAFLGQVTGYGPNITLHQAAGLNDINREIYNNLPQPDWAYSRWPQYGGNTTLELVTELKRIKRINDFNKPTLHYLRGGLGLGHWLQNVESVVNAGQTNKPRMTLYSAHEGTLLALLHAFGLENDQLVPYAAVLIMEVYRDKNNVHYVKLLYRHSGKVWVKLIPGCEEICPADKFLKLLNARAIPTKKKLHQLCKLSKPTQLESTITVSVFKTPDLNACVPVSSLANSKSKKMDKSFNKTKVARVVKNPLEFYFPSYIS